jgi:hypothetical protein
MNQMFYSLTNRGTSNHSLLFMNLVDYYSVQHSLAEEPLSQIDLAATIAAIVAVGSRATHASHGRSSRNPRESVVYGATLRTGKMVLTNRK